MAPQLRTGKRRQGATPWKLTPWTQTPHRQRLRGLLHNSNPLLRGTIRGANPNDVFHLDKVTLALKRKFIQINLHHSKAATALLCHKLAIGKMDVALIQEPWVHGDRIRGLCNRWGILFSAGPGIASRACISVSNTIQAFPLLELCSRHVMTVRLSFNGGGNIRDLIVTSVYLPYDSDEPPPSRELWDVINYCCRNNLQLIAGCDANAHHIAWGSTSINPRGRSLLEYLVSANLNILNKGNKPTFVVSNRQKIIDLTLGTDKVGDLVSDWHVSDETSLSDHRYILFQVSDRNF
jgi:hypothetical protein